MNKALLRGVVTASLLVLGLGNALADTIKFDDILDTVGGSAIPNGYHGLNWDNFYVLNAQNYASPSGYINGTISGPNVALNWYANPATAWAATPFTFTSAYFTAAWNNDLTVDVQAFLGGNLVNSTSFVVNTTGPILETFNWQGIDRLVFSSHGGTPAGLAGSGAHFAMDNMSINAVPEPETYAMLLAGLGLMGALARRKGKAG